MNQEQIERIPTNLLRAEFTKDLRTYLYARGLQMTLAQLDAERRRRGLTPPMQRQKAAPRHERTT